MFSSNFRYASNGFPCFDVNPIILFVFPFCNRVLAFSNDIIFLHIVPLILKEHFSKFLHPKPYLFLITSFPHNGHRPTTSP